MQYGFFDDARREYVMTRPDTPRSWINYLGSRLFGGIITQNAGGYCFYKSGGLGRIMRMRFNGIPSDQPGRYVYLRDDESGDYWSASWQPVGKSLDEYSCSVRHGLGYSVFESAYAGIKAGLTCFIPRERAFEIWSLEIANPGTAARKISVFTYAELANEWNSRMDMENLQYSQYIVRVSFADGMIYRKTETNPGTTEAWFAAAGAEIASFDADRDAFLGPYRTPADPLAVERGRCSDSVAVGDNGCASLHLPLVLEPGASRRIVFMLGVGSPSESWNGLPSGKEAIAEFGESARVDAELAAIRNEWAERLETLRVETPDAELDSMANVWHAYQTHVTFNWSRSASLVESGGRDGLGFRDTVQDMLAVTHSVPAEVGDRLDLILTGQAEAGCGLPLVDFYGHRPGREEVPPISRIRSDDALWLPFTVSNYVYETGDLAYLDRVLPYADRGEGTVFAHLMNALRFGADHKGAHGLLQGLAADWNDCMPLGEGESVFTTFLYYAACRLTAELAELKGAGDEAAWCAHEAAAARERADRAAWDGEWYARAITAGGERLGSGSNREGRIYIESNVWAVMSGAASGERAASAMEAVHRYLATEHGLMLCHPAHTEPFPGIALPLVYPPGHKENGGIFCHSNAWAVIAECVLGNGDRAYEYYRSFLPARYNAAAEVRQAEPYVYAQFTYGKPSPRFGQSRNPWLTGTASWTYIALTQHILGLRPRYLGLELDPCLPKAWKGFEARRTFRGKRLNVTVRNPDGVNRGLASLILNGERIEGSVLPAERLLEENEVRAVLG